MENVVYTSTRGMCVIEIGILLRHNITDYKIRKLYLINEREFCTAYVKLKVNCLRIFVVKSTLAPILFLLVTCEWSQSRVIRGQLLFRTDQH